MQFAPTSTLYLFLEVFPFCRLILCMLMLLLFIWLILILFNLCSWRRPTLQGCVAQKECWLWMIVFQVQLFVFIREIQCLSMSKMKEVMALPFTGNNLLSIYLIPFFLYNYLNKLSLSWNMMAYSHLAKVPLIFPSNLLILRYELAQNCQPITI